MQHWSRRLAHAWRGRGALAVALLPVAALYAALVALRRLLYRTGLLRVHAAGVPVVVVGNLVAGGAGKTPTVLAVVRLLRARGFTPGIVSRGHGRRGDAPLLVTPHGAAAEAGDEPLLLARASGVPVAVARARVAAARLLRAAHPAVDVIVADDGLQHLALARDVQVIVFDERGAGNGWLLPAGPLREPVPRRLPPATLVLYNAPAPTTHLPGHAATRRLAGVVRLADWWAGATPRADALAALRGRPVLAAAGIAVPERFFALLHDAGLAVTPLALPDHHAYATLPWPAPTRDVVVTEKDAVKLAPERIAAPTTVWVAALDFAPDPAFADALAALLPSPRRDGNPPA